MLDTNEIQSDYRATRRRQWLKDRRDYNLAEAFIISLGAAVLLYFGAHLIAHFV